MNENMKAAWLEISQMLGEPTREELDVFLRTWQRAIQSERNRTWTQEDWTEYERSIAAAEREACAKVCDIHARGWEMNPGQNPQAAFIAASNCATAIRARGNT